METSHFEAGKGSGNGFPKDGPEQDVGFRASKIENRSLTFFWPRFRRITHEDPFAPVTAIHDAMNRASMLDSQRAGHGWGVASAALVINIKN